MPLRDGKGPNGKGPLTGRGLGNCLFGDRRKKSGSFSFRKCDGLGLAVVGIIVHDIANSDGITRKLIQGVTHHIAGFVQLSKSMMESKERQQISNHKLAAERKLDSGNSTLTK